MSPLRRGKTPAWVTVVIILCVLPVFSFPALLAWCPPGHEGVRMLLWCYPFYAVVAAWLAWVCWPERPYMTWILLALMLLSHASAWGMVLLNR